jgi:hypothetical protein
MPVSNQDILKTILLQELDRMEPEQSTFEDDPMQFILKKYAGLKNTLEYLMTPSFEEYITGIYVVAPKPTTFKVVLHNGQFFFLQFMGKAYEATVEGKKYYLMSIGEKERCMVAISRLLRFGNPLKTKGPDGAEQATRDSEGPAEEAGPTPPAETSAEEGGGEELTGSKILEVILKEADTKRASNFELALVLAWYDIFKPKSDEVYSIGGLTPELVKIIKADKKMYEGAINAINSYKSTFKGKSAYKVGRDASTTSFWKSFGASDNTPKTDVILGSARVSVKAGNAQLLSAGKNESEATLAASVKNTPGIKKSPLYKELQNVISQFVKVGYTKKGTVGTVLKKGKDEDINKAEKLHKRSMELLKQLFSSNKDFKTAFMKEAMSGAEKFGPSSPACAEYVLSTSKDFTNPQLHKIDDSYSDKVGNQVRIQVRFKSTSESLKGQKTGRYRYWSALSGILDPSKVKESELSEDESNSSDTPVDVDVLGSDSIDFGV